MQLFNGFELIFVHSSIHCPFNIDLSSNRPLHEEKLMHCTPTQHHICTGQRRLKKKQKKGLDLDYEAGIIL